MPSIPVTSSSGLNLTGLTVGQRYRVTSSLGPFHPHGIGDGSDDDYQFQLSEDGVTWSNSIGGIGNPSSQGTGVYYPSWATGRVNLDNKYSGIDFVAHTTSIWARVADSVWSDNTGTLSASITGPFDYCAYGTGANPDAQVYTTITATLVDAAVLALGGGVLLVTALDTLIGAPLLLGDLCSSPPPATPVFTDADFIAGTQIWAPGSFDKRMQAFKAGIWHFYCRCTPSPGGGSPDPVDYPLPTPVSGPASGTAPPITVNCDDTAICTLLNQIVRQLTALQLQVTSERSDVQLIQRQKVPFAYVPGTLHTGLTGSGTLAVQGILGLSIDSTSIPSYLSSDMAPVQSWFKLGEVSWGTSDGWQARRVVTHNPHLFLDIDGDVTGVAYDFEPGVVANILELLREP